MCLIHIFYRSKTLKYLSFLFYYYNRLNRKQNIKTTKAMKWEKVFEYVISIVLIIVWITITGMLLFSTLFSTKLIGLIFLFLGILLIYKTITDKKT